MEGDVQGKVDRLEELRRNEGTDMWFGMRGGRSGENDGVGGFK